MDKKHRLMSLLGSAVILGLGAEGMTQAHAGEGKCAGMKNTEGSGQTKEATCGGMKKEEKDKAKKKQKEMTCAGPGGCGGKPSKEGSES
ncbi:hypothetical protein [Hydrogenivirga sp. 128-5-R1-1]|uniref:hypothetical protein n=1 Tax=Hydrogenivirga sp. 128-5-R1-1 TaxID=392423 RepID=UPI00015F36BD|nr:hypothetical protein [Hydrogenivirga sp. 128-5-R1-1]EDP76330.1 hypothetical protein HG1285_01948 [Hydrogenivirga sp. 128-5-R1-1]